MKLALLTLALLLAGCADPDPPYLTAPTQYRCTMEQAKQVDFETRTCDSAGASGFFGSYCYGTAIMRNCQKLINGQVMPKAKENGNG